MLHLLPVKPLGWLLVLLLLLFSPVWLDGQTEVWYEDQVAVIAYHHIDEQVQSDVTITPALFENQLKDLLSRGYHFITLQQFRDFKSGGPVPPNAVLVTFDDGYESFYTKAYPIMAKLGIPAVDFVITKDLDNPMGSLVPSMSRDQIRDIMNHSANFDMECHSDSLHGKQDDGSPLFTSRLLKDGHKESDAEYATRIVQDTSRCVSKLEQLSPQPIDAFAYPFGSLDSPSAQLLPQAGIKYAFTTVSEMAIRSDELLQTPRINAGSPFIHPQSLHNLIIKRIVSSLPEKLDLQNSTQQLGGKCTLEHNGTVELQWGDNRWNLKEGSISAVAADQSFQMQEPLLRVKDRYYITTGDLQTMFGSRITYNGNTGMVYRRLTPSVK